jgi:hypothetical protein
MLKCKFYLNGTNYYTLHNILNFLLHHPVSDTTFTCKTYILQ